MSVTRHHAEWLNLVEASGPFLSPPVLRDVFPQGLEKVDSCVRRTLREAYDQWRGSQESRRPDPAIHRAWIEYVLGRLLELDQEGILVSGQAAPQGMRARSPEHGEEIHPDYVVLTPAGRKDSGRPRLVVLAFPSGQGLDKVVAGARWKASPATRMLELLQALADVNLGLVTNGEEWMLIYAPPGEPTTYASWRSWLMLEEPVTLQAFRGLLSVARFFGVPDDQTLEALLDRSARDQQEVTDQLGLQVRRAVEVLVSTVDRLDQDRGGALLAEVPEGRLYEAALTVMMRLVFLFCAEERDMLPARDALYVENYGVSELCARLRAEDEQVLERRYDAWSRLLATFRVVHAGVTHDRLRLPAYGGRLFDPDRFPFLEGRTDGVFWQDVSTEPLRVDNRTVLKLLESLQFLEVPVPGGGRAESRRLSFRALDIEQIGHVYEGLLDHAAVRSRACVLGLKGGKGREPEIPLDRLEDLQRSGTDALVEYLAKETGRGAGTLEKALEAAVRAAGDDGLSVQSLKAALDATRLQRLQALCGNEADLLERVLPFALLLREDAFEYPVVIRPGSVYVTRGSDRRSTGTHYTPRSLTEPLVRYALEPLVYEGPAEGLPGEEWRLRGADEMLKLRVCDMAMGSGAFLVQACRYLAERLVEAWDEAEKRHPGRPRITPEGQVSEGGLGETLIPLDGDERMALAQRLVADRCLYGVDKNPMAVEMAKLSLWLVTMQKDRPFTFLDHALKCGDSLLGITSLEQIEHFHMDPERGKDLHLTLEDFRKALGPALKDAVEKRRQLEEFQVLEVKDADEKARLLAQADAELDALRVIGDLIVGAAIETAGGSAKSLDDRLEDLLSRVADALRVGVAEDERGRRLDALRALAGRMLEKDRREDQPERKCFHWALEFPEVFRPDVAAERRGFDAIIGNPPFIGGQRITGALGTDYRDYLVTHVGRGQRGSADLCAYFFLRARDLLVAGGQFGLLATNTIAQGDTREVGLEQIVKAGCVIIRAVPSCKWPGEANLQVAHVWARKSQWKGTILLDETPVAAISPLLMAEGRHQWKPVKLASSCGISWMGSIVLGMGFTLPPSEAEALISSDPRNKEVLFPYLNGDDVTTSVSQSASRWVINFQDWPLERAETYPECMRIVRHRAKPERDRLANGDTTAQDRARRWWQFARPTTQLYSQISEMPHILAIPLVSKYLIVTLEPTSQVFSNTLGIVALARHSELAVLQSTSHEAWVRFCGSTLETRMRYTPSDCFETFPFPLDLSSLESIGERYYTHRQSIMTARQEGLTKTYNRFHNPKESSADIARLRELHVELDQAVAAAYGWADLDLGHGFHETKQGMRYTISEPARAEILDRLLALNHERHEEEVRQGLHANGKGRKKKAVKA